MGPLAARLEREEFERIVLIQMQQEEAERVRAEEERQQRHNHCEELKKQIQVILTCPVLNEQQ